MKLAISVALFNPLPQLTAGTVPIGSPLEVQIVQLQSSSYSLNSLRTLGIRPQLGTGTIKRW